MADGSHSGFLNFGHELVVVHFAGFGGAEIGIERAYRAADIAINHSPVAVAVHRANHPDTQHHQCDIFEVDPVEATKGRPVGILWASPDCRHHSKAKGGKPRSKRVRALAWVVVKWAKVVKPRLIFLENVEEFEDWGPLNAAGQPDPARKGLTFRRWVRQLENLGYKVEWRERIAANTGAPTIRKRLYLVARCDGRPIVWPEGQYAKVPTENKLPWKTAADHCIDWSIPGKSIFGRKKPLAKNTQRRIARGLWRYSIANPNPYLVPLRGTSASHTSTHSVRAPLSTVSGQGTHHALIEPYVTAFGQNALGYDVREPSDTVLAGAIRYGLVAGHLTECANGSAQRCWDADEPMRTVCANVKGGHIALAAGTLIQVGYGEREGQAPRCLDHEAPLGTVVGSVKHAVVAAHLTHLTHHGDRSGYPVTDAMRTVTGANRGEQALVTACFVKYYSEGGQWQAANEPMHTVPTKDRMGVVEAAHVPADWLSPEQLEGARRVAAFLHEQLPEHFPEPFDVLLVGGYAMVDITLRMLVPRELARANAIPENYILDWGLFETTPGSGRFIWKPISKTDQVKLVGNCVCPTESEALVAANAADLIAFYRQQEAA